MCEEIMDELEVDPGSSPNKEVADGASTATGGDASGSCFAVGSSSSPPTGARSLALDAIYFH